MPKSHAPRMPERGEKWCPRCKTFKAVSEFTGGYCNTCRREYNRAWEKGRGADAIPALWKRLVEGYGRKCVSCGEARAATLTLYSRGGERAQMGGTPARRSEFMRDLIRRGYPSGYELLCANCGTMRATRIAQRSPQE